MTDSLQNLIEQARRAKAEQDAETQKKVLAAMLPSLEAQAETERQKEQANAAYTQAIADARRYFEDVRPEYERWQKRFMELCAELEAHLQEGQRLQGSLLDAGREVRDACYFRASLENTRPYDEFLSDRGFGPAWVQAGGADEGLSLLPDLDPNGLPAKVVKLLRFSPVRGVDIPRVLSGF